MFKCFPTFETVKLLELPKIEPPYTRSDRRDMYEPQMNGSE